MAAAVAVAGGCSADVTRFNLGTFTTGAIPTPYAPTRGPAPAYAPAPQETAPPPIAPSQDYRVIGRTYDPPPVTRPYPAPSSPPPYGAPPYGAPPYGAPPYSAPPYTPPASKLPPYTAPPAHQEPPPAPAPPSAALAKPPPALAPSPGTATVEVRAGDTLYSIARRHGVTASALKELNDLPSMVVRPGQRLTVPSEATRDREPPVNGAPSPPFGEGTGGKAKPESAAPSDGERRHVIRDGDSLPAIAEQHKVTLEELKRANSITDQAKLRAGTVLIVPRRAEPGAGPAQGLPPRVVQVKPRIIRAPEGPSEALPQKTAGGNDMASAAAPPPAVAGGKFRWPIRGRVILAFGAQSDGAKNEGVSLAAPMGTDVQAAEAGRVHYVGDGLKGYGNLVLIRHGNDWATAYAHVDRILVKAGEEVKRGQVIAKVGKSGPVTQPQLKFELRKASVPVDPLPHLAN